ncbi:MAG TPA: GIY-YIG nuclease family protein [Candidatus Dojkabacteria bacterium]|nr:GIY-YIG nuclease family protein [Candidatus Dojkabacteria bacterium]
MNNPPSKYFVYILYSKNIDRYYTGVTYSPELRLSRHLSKLSRFTKQTDDWKLVKTFEFKARSEAMKFEKHIKKMKSRNFIEELIAGCLTAVSKGE